MARMKCAVELLAQHVPIGDVALELGYDGVSSFITQFRRTFGTTPARYRAGVGTVAVER
jgi:AraC-like DNA-binding protein